MIERHRNPGCSLVFGRCFLGLQRHLKNPPRTTEVVAEGASRIAIDHADGLAIGDVARIRTAMRQDSVIVVTAMIDVAVEIASKTTSRKRTPPQRLPTPAGRTTVALTRTAKINQSDQDVVVVDAVANVAMTQPPPAMQQKPLMT
jgi:hypothetical protein